MKNTVFLSVLLLAAVFISSCNGPNGPDGEDGSAFVAIVSSDETLNSGGTFSSFSPGSYYNTYYRTDPGTYSFSFIASYYDSYGFYHARSWYGTYTISINYGSPGGKGKPFWKAGEPGADGSDLYYKLNCTYSYGLSIYSNDYLFTPPSVNPDSLVEGKVYTRDYSDNRYTVHIECQMKNRQE